VTVGSILGDAVLSKTAPERLANFQNGSQGIGKAHTIPEACRFRWLPPGRGCRVWSCGFCWGLRPTIRRGASGPTLELRPTDCRWVHYSALAGVSEIWRRNLSAPPLPSNQPRSELTTRSRRCGGQSGSLPPAHGSATLSTTARAALGYRITLGKDRRKRAIMLKSIFGSSSSEGYSPVPVYSKEPTAAATSVMVVNEPPRCPKTKAAAS
jgi:hypothetical protein